MMRHIFSAAGKTFLQSVMRERPLLAFDFDGTLAPIVANPDEASVPLAVGRRLAVLVNLLPVAIVTGRSVDDVKERLDFCPAFIIGNHGAEGWDPVAEQMLVPQFDELRVVLAVHRTKLEELGIVIEDKGLSVALHYRIARDRIAAKAFICALLAQLKSPLGVSFGKCVANVTASNAPDKGVAVISASALRASKRRTARPSMTSAIAPSGERTTSCARSVGRLLRALTAGCSAKGDFTAGFFGAAVFVMAMASRSVSSAHRREQAPWRTAEEAARSACGWR